MLNPQAGAAWVFFSNIFRFYFRGISNAMSFITWEVGKTISLAMERFIATTVDSQFVEQRIQLEHTPFATFKKAAIPFHS